jgi:hypothetical protein
VNNFTFGLTQFYNMVKRKPSTSSDLKTSPIQLSLHRYKDLPILQASARSKWNIEHLQPFFPPIECLFKSEQLEFVHEYGIKFREQINLVSSVDQISIANQLKTVHIKKTMLLSPFKWMQGDYGTSIGLPTTTEQSREINSKLQNPNNAAYVGALVSSVLSESGCQHFPKVYGVFTGFSQKHTIDLSDDYPDLCDRSWFSQNIGKTFDLRLLHDNSKPLIELGEDIELGDVEELQTEHVESHIANLENEVMVSEEEDETDSSVSTSYIFNIHSCKCDELDREIMDEEDEDEGASYAWATFTNVPVQLTIMEKCEGTFYELLTANVDPEKHTAWLTQVMFALAYAQRNFGFVHNDLHSNNVMYVPTDKEFLYYNLAGVLYKVPTFGYLIKIIDFERGISSIRLVGMKEPKFFMSDHFAVNEEAGGQYNYNPFYISKYPEVKPNASFDLVRLATSLFWDFFPEGPNHEPYVRNPLFCYFRKWLMIEDGTSVLFGKEDPRHDRYHGFTLYKAIARYCRDTAVPRKELVNVKVFYEVPSVPLNENCLCIDS